LDISWQIKLLIIFCLFLLSAFFSGSEVALFSLDKKILENRLSANPLISRYLLRLLEYPRRLLVTILVGNTIVSVGASIVAVSIVVDIYTAYHLNPNLVLTLQIIVLTILIILFGELIPKVWASKNPLSFAKAVAIPLYWVNTIFYPISDILTELVRGMISKLIIFRRIDKSKSAILPEEFSELADIGHERGTLFKAEQGLIQSIVKFREVEVHEVMTPRVDIIAISKNTDFKELIKIVTASAYSRLPLFKDNLDEILGIIYAKDLLSYLKNYDKQKQIDLIKISRKALFVPETKLVSDLFNEFQEKKMHLAIVVDEYGGTAGLVTLEDILEEVIGEIRDEYDKEENPVTKINEETFIVQGMLPIDELNELLNIRIPIDNEDFETLGGFILNNAGSIPKEGYFFQLENYKFTVKEVFKKRVMKVLIEKIKGE
jgi:magnesium and cobalt exporter, CNNM family